MPRLNSSVPTDKLAFWNDLIEFLDISFMLFNEWLPPDMRPESFVRICESLKIDPWGKELNYLGLTKKKKKTPNKQRRNKKK